ncbi:MAG: carboxypeptidase-like regulatory domain-containing protein [Bacteroidales bacterium]
MVVALNTTLFGQLTQTIRGDVVERITQQPLPGANIVVLGCDPLKGTATDAEGRFVLRDVPVGRVDLKITFLGYRDEVLRGLKLTSAHELLLHIGMEELPVMAGEVVITAGKSEGKPLNEMATVSSRSFSVEASERYAGARNDVARMAANYAGVRGTDDSRNDIIIRGNSPIGLLWRLEGIDIPNPNHYGASETTGGPVSLINTNQLANSDFYTGAFPAEYGNALSGVFDLKLRNGNNSKTQFLGQVGFNGFELGGEGPLFRKKGGSWMFNYRYSTLEVFHLLGIQFGTGTAIPKYSDFSAKVHLPAGKAGTFSFFAIGGKSSISLKDSERDTSDQKLDFYGGEGFDLINGSDLLVAGLAHSIQLGRKGYSRLVLSWQTHSFDVQLDSITPVTHEILPWFRNEHNEHFAIADWKVNRKFSSKHSVRGGISYKLMNLYFIDSLYYDELNRFKTLTEYDGQAGLIQPFVSWKYDISNRLSLVTGVHYLLFTYNRTQSLEPRTGLSWSPADGQSLSFGYGYHSQLAPITLYFSRYQMPDGSYVQPNKELDLVRSHHFVLGYQRFITEHVQLKGEVYYQAIRRAGVDAREETAYSTLNQGAQFYVYAPDSLTSKGTGSNRGIELTAEHFLNNGLYYLATASLYTSRYKGSDQIERYTAFDGTFILNFVGGKEWLLGKRKEHTGKLQLITADGKITWAGGQRYTPATAVKLPDNTYVAVYDHSRAFSLQYPDYFRLDLRVAYKVQKAKTSMEWAIDIQNLFNYRNIYNQKFNSKTGEFEYTYQMGRLIIPQFKILF